MPQGDICIHLVQGGSLHQLERGGIYTAAVKAHVLVQLLLFPSIYLTQERRGIILRATCSTAVLCTQTSPRLLLMLLPSYVRHSSRPLYLRKPSGFPCLYCQIPSPCRNRVIQRFSEKMGFCFPLLKEGVNIFSFPF